jgi:hypothetical protein
MVLAQLVHRATFRPKINAAWSSGSLLRTSTVQCAVLNFREARMAIYHRWIAALLMSCALAACASTASPGARAVIPAAAATPSPERVHVTGSRIALPVDPYTGMPQTASPMQIVSQDELTRSGRMDLGSALRNLVPQLH